MSCHPPFRWVVVVNVHVLGPLAWVKVVWVVVVASVQLLGPLPPTAVDIKLRPMAFQRAQLRLARDSTTRLIRAGQRRDGGCGGLAARLAGCPTCACRSTPSQPQSLGGLQGAAGRAAQAGQVDKQPVEAKKKGGESRSAAKVAAARRNVKKAQAAAIKRPQLPGGPCLRCGRTKAGQWVNIACMSCYTNYNFRA